MMELNFSPGILVPEAALLANKLSCLKSLVEKTCLILGRLDKVPAL